MKKIILSGFIAAVAVTILFLFFSKKESDYSLQLVVSSWTDKGADYNQEFDFKNIRLNETYVIPLEEASFYLREFKIVKIKANSITIATSLPLSENRDGVYLDTKSKFIIKDDMPLILRTFTMDAGEGYTFSLYEKE